MAEPPKARVSWWSIAYWLALVVAAVFLVLFAINRQKLAEELGRNKAELDRAESAVAEIEQRRAIAQSGTLYAREVFGGANLLLADLQANLPQFCTGDANQRNFCERFTNEALLRRPLADAAIVRLQAQTPDDYAEVTTAYRRLEQLVETVSSGVDRNHWRAVAKEGVANSLYRQGNLAGAEQAIEAAWRLDSRSAIVGVTRLKIMCARHEDESIIQRELSEMRERFQQTRDRLAAAAARYPSSAMSRAADEAARQRRLIESDDDLYRQCRNAGIRPETIAASAR